MHNLKRKTLRQWVVAICMVLMVPMMQSTAWSVEPDEILNDPALEERARDLSAKLRCLVCQNQSIDDSDAPLAKDLRVLVRERLTAGDSNDQVMDYVVGRYGEFVLLQPKFAWHTILLWVTPFVALIIGFFGFRSLSRREIVTTSDVAKLSTEEEDAINKMLDEKR